MLAGKLEHEVWVRLDSLEDLDLLVDSAQRWYFDIMVDCGASLLNAKSSILMKTIELSREYRVQIVYEKRDRQGVFDFIKMIASILV